MFRRQAGVSGGAAVRSGDLVDQGRAAHTSGTEPIPALVVRFAPELDDHNAAQAGRRFSFPVYVRRNGAQEPGRVTTPVVEISYDDGKTWQQARRTR